LTDVTSGGGVLFGTEVQLKQGTLFLKIRDRELGCSLEIYVPVDTCVRDQQVHREARLNSSTQGVSNHVVVVVGGGGGGRPGYQEFGDRSTPAKEEQQIRLEKVVQRDKSKGKTIKSRCI
jgi:hypothetical protein